MSKTMIELVVKQVAFFTVLNQIRQQATDEDDRRLTESIRLHGILQPIGVRPDGRVVWGHRRLRCAIRAGLTEVPCVLLGTDMTEGQYLTLQMIENAQRADVSPFDMWQGCVRLQEANNWQLKDVAHALSLDPATVTRLMSVSKCVPAWRDALKAGAVGIGDCYAASKLPEADQPGLLALKLQGATRDDLARASRKARAPKAEEAVKTGSLRITLGGVVITVKGADLTLGLVAEVLERAGKEAEKAKAQGLNAKTAERVWKDRAAKKAG